MRKTVVMFFVEVEHEGELDKAELQEHFVEPINEGIRTAFVTGPAGVKRWEPKGANIPTIF